jgi:hypothetical protein
VLVFPGGQRGGRVAVDKVRAEPPRLLIGPPGQFRSADAARESEVVPDPGARPGLAAERFQLQQHGGQALRGRVHRGGQAGGPGSHDDQVIGRTGRAHVDSERLGDLGVARIHEHDAVEQRHHRPGGPVDAQPRERLAAFGGVAAVETERNAVAGQDVADLVGPDRWLFPDHGYRLEPPAPLAPPFLERLGDSPVELLVGGPGGPGHVELHLPQCQRRQDRPGRCQVIPCDQQPAPRRGRDVPHPRQELGPRHPRHPAVGQDQRHSHALRPELGQPGQRRLRGRSGHDPVVHAVA